MIPRTVGSTKPHGIRVQVELVWKKTLQMPTMIGFQPPIRHQDHPIPEEVLEDQRMPKVTSSSMRLWQTHGRVTTTAHGQVENGLKSTTMVHLLLISRDTGCKTLQAT